MSARVLQSTDLALAVRALRNGELVAIPTETVYGLAGLALDPVALAKIFAAKARPTFDPLIAHVQPSPAGTRLEALATAGLVDFSALQPAARATAEALADACWPGPLTLVLPRARGVPDLCTAGLNSVAVRMPAHPLAQEILRRVGQPLAAPSANRFGRISPTTAAHVLQELGERIDWIVDGGPCAVGVESTVVAVQSDGSCALLRPGGVPQARLETLSGHPVFRPDVSPIALPSPGLLASHYAPVQTLHMLSAPLHALDADARARMLRPEDVVLVASGEAKGLTVAQRVLLSPDGSDSAAAQRLFACLREMDCATGKLYAEPITQTDGLWPAIADRLGRASGPRS